MALTGLGAYSLADCSLGAYSLEAYSLQLPILNQVLHSPVLNFSGGLSGGLQSPTTDFGPGFAFTCAHLGAYSLGGYSLGAYRLQLQILSQVLHLPVL